MTASLIRRNRAILNPWKATASTVIAQRPAYTRIHSYPKDIDLKARAFLEEGCQDTGFLRDNDISVIYSLIPCRNPDLVMVRENVYPFNEATGSTPLYGK